MDEDNILQEIIGIYTMWDKLYPERYAPGEVPTRTFIELYNKANILRETPIQKRIRNMITGGKRFLDNIDYRWNPELAPKKYYSDGIPVDWHNLEESNQAYLNRCEENEFKLPGIDVAIRAYNQKN